MSERQKDYPAISRLAGDRELDAEHNDIAGPQTTNFEGSSTTQATDGPPLDREPGISSDPNVETITPPMSASESSLSADNRLNNDADQDDPQSGPGAAGTTERNRKNAERSTGPKTSAGKERASQNARKYGIYATTILLPGESKTAYRNLRNRMREDYPTKGAVEEALLEQAVNARWRLRRLDIAERLRGEHFQKRQACEIEQPITIINGKRVDAKGELEDILDRFAEDAALSGEDLRRAFRRSTDSANLEQSSSIGRERRRLTKEFLDALEELEKRQRRRQHTSDNSETE